MMESELKDATETWLGGKTLVLSTSNEADAIEAIMEEKRERKKDRKMRSKCRSKKMKKMRREKLGESFHYK